MAEAKIAGGTTTTTIKTQFSHCRASKHLQPLLPSHAPPPPPRQSPSSRYVCPGPPASPPVPRASSRASAPPSPSLPRPLGMNGHESEMVAQYSAMTPHATELTAHGSGTAALTMVPNSAMPTPKREAMAHGKTKQNDRCKRTGKMDRRMRRGPGRQQNASIACSPPPPSPRYRSSIPRSAPLTSPSSPSRMMPHTIPSPRQPVPIPRLWTSPHPIGLEHAHPWALAHTPAPAAPQPSPAAGSSETNPGTCGL